MLLAIDTSTRWVGLALYDGVSIPAELIWQSHSNHTVELAPSLDLLLKRAQVQPEDLKAIGVALGPGSFTSLRIGLGLAKGMALALRIPVIGIPTLDITAASQPIRDLPLTAVLQAGRGRLGLGWYAVHAGRWQSQAEPRVITAEALADEITQPTLVCGELSPEDRQLLTRKRKNVILASPAQSLRRPAFLAELAWKRYRAGKMDDPVSLSPIYLHIAEPIPS